MDIDEFKYVLALAQYKNFTEASYEISLSQSSLSKHLAKIERELGGVRLFDRASRPIKLTPAGEEFIRLAHHIIKDFEALKAAMHECTIQSQGHLTIGSIPVMGRLGLTQLIVSFQKQFPKIDIEIKERQNRELVDLLKRSELDLALLTITESQMVNSHVNFLPIIEDEIVLISDRRHPLANQTSINLKDVKNEVFILLDSDSGMYPIYLDAFHTAGFMPKIQQTRNSETIVSLVAEGLGISLLTCRLVDTFDASKIAKIRLNQPFKRTIALASRNQLHTPLPVKKFLDHASKWRTALPIIS